MLEDGFRRGDAEVLPRPVCVRSDAGEKLIEPGVTDALVTRARRNGNRITRDEFVGKVPKRPTAGGSIERACGQNRGSPN